MHLNLHGLRIFHAVARTGSFTRAAEQLFLTQPAISKAVRELEGSLGLVLLERTVGGGTRARGARLTQEGAALFEHARAIFSLEQAAIDDLRARAGAQRGRLFIGASTTVAAYWLAPFLARMRAGHPEAELQVVSGNTGMIETALLDCSVDLAIVEGSVADPRIEAVFWRGDDMEFVVGGGSGPAMRRLPPPRRLSEGTWLLRETGSGTREATERVLRDLGVQAAHVIVLGSNEAIARAAAAGIGYALLPRGVIQDLVSLGALRTLRAPEGLTLERPLRLLRLRGRPDTPLAAAFRRILEAPERPGPARRVPATAGMGGGAAGTGKEKAPG